MYNFFSSSRYGKRLRFGMLTLFANIRSSKVLSQDGQHPQDSHHPQNSHHPQDGHHPKNNFGLTFIFRPTFFSDQNFLKIKKKRFDQNFYLGPKTFFRPKYFLAQNILLDQAKKFSDKIFEKFQTPKFFSDQKFRTKNLFRTKKSFIDQN